METTVSIKSREFILMKKLKRQTGDFSVKSENEEQQESTSTPGWTDTGRRIRVQPRRAGAAGHPCRFRAAGVTAPLPECYLEGHGWEMMGSRGVDVTASPSLPASPCLINCSLQREPAGELRHRTAGQNRQTTLQAARNPRTGEWGCMFPTMREAWPHLGKFSVTAQKKE